MTALEGIEHHVLRFICALGHQVRTGRWPDIDSPKTFNDKVQHFKLNTRDRGLLDYIDKVAVKSIVAGRLGPDWVIPTLYEGTSVPPERLWPTPYVIKANNSSARNAFVRSPQEEDWRRIRARAARWLRTPHPWATGEWLYRQIEPKILVEPLLGGDTLPADYKFFVFSGKVHAIEVDTDRGHNQRRTFHDTAWNVLPFEMYYPRAEHPIARPRSLDAMIGAAETLARDFPFARVDLYEIDGQPLFGEITFTPGAGVKPFRPASVDRELGDLWPYPPPGPK